MQKLSYIVLAALILSSAFVSTNISSAQSILPGEHDWQNGVFEPMANLYYPEPEYCVDLSGAIYNCALQPVPGFGFPDPYLTGMEPGNSFAPRPLEHCGPHQPFPFEDEYSWNCVEEKLSEWPTDSWLD